MLYQEIAWQTPIEIFSLLAHLPGILFLESSNAQFEAGRYSFIAVDPFATLIGKNENYFFNQKKIQDNPFDILQFYFKKFTLIDDLNLPPFQGGIAGLFSYDLNRALEKLPQPQVDDMQFPDLAVGLYDLVLAFDHRQKKFWIFSSGFPEKKFILQKKRAIQRMEWVKSFLQKKTYHWTL